MPSNFLKAIWDLKYPKYINAGNGDSALGGELTGVPSAIGASQGSGVRPGDRIILGHADALALSDTSNVGTLYGGLYQYVKMYLSSTAASVRGKLAFRYTTLNTNAEDQLHQVTADESMGQGVNCRAGVFINVLTKGNYGWIQIAGKVTLFFKASLTGTAADGVGVYAAAVGSGEPGKVDVLAGADMGNNTALYYGIVDNMIKRFVGVALGAPSNNNLTLVDMPIRYISY
jgi:hypothetical protein